MTESRNILVFKRLAKEIKILKKTIKSFKKEGAYTIDIKQAEILLNELKEEQSFSLYRREVYRNLSIDWYKAFLQNPLFDNLRNN